MTKPLHIGVCSGIGPHTGRYVISAEYLNGYDVLGVYDTAEEARADLLLARRRHLKRLELSNLRVEDTERCWNCRNNWEPSEADDMRCTYCDAHVCDEPYMDRERDR